MPYGRVPVNPDAGMGLQPIPQVHVNFSAKYMKVTTGYKPSRAKVLQET